MGARIERSQRRGCRPMSSRENVNVTRQECLKSGYLKAYVYNIGMTVRMNGIVQQKYSYKNPKECTKN